MAIEIRTISRVYNVLVPRFSLVIPAFNEERYLPRLLDSVDLARTAYRGGRNNVEIIVADNLSTDATAAIAAAAGCKVVSVQKKVIGAVRNGGAAPAIGDILCFVDADARLHPETFNVIEDELASPKIVGGATGIRPERWSLGFAATYAILVPIVVMMRMDTGVVFSRRDDFVAIGGYDESRRVAEDVAFLFALRRLGKTRGQRLTRATGAKAVASLRKFDEHGEWHYLRLMPAAALALLRRKQMTEFEDLYWYKPKR
jgi:glycosyltransferase involved in cell wall biosynthesis